MAYDDDLLRDDEETATPLAEENDLDVGDEDGVLGTDDDEEEDLDAFGLHVEDEDAL